MDDNNNNDNGSHKPITTAEETMQFLKDECDRLSNLRKQLVNAGRRSRADILNIKVQGLKEVIDSLTQRMRTD